MKRRIAVVLLTLFILIGGMWLPAQSLAYAAAPTNAWQAQYFANTSLTGNPALVQSVPSLSLDWGNGSPGPSIPNDNWSARFTRSIQFTAGWYRFTTLSDDGVRVLVDGKTVLQQWYDMPGTRFNVDVYLSEGSHVITVEYYEHGGAARVSFDWTRFDGDPVYSGWKGEYYRSLDLSGKPMFVRDDSTINFNWTLGVYPGVGLAGANFSVRWTKPVQFSAGTYHFEIKVWGGVRLYVDDQKVIDAWTNTGSTTVKGDASLKSGTHTVKVEYSAHADRGLIQLSWSQTSTPSTPPPPTFSDWKGEYFDNPYLVGEPKVVRNDTAVNFDWQAGSPDGSIPADNFSARWTRALNFNAGTYRFYVRSDDGARLWVDNQLVLDRWNDQAAATYSVDINLTQGVHTIRLEYYEHTGLAEAKLWWESVAIQQGSWQVEYFDNMDLSGSPTGAGSAPRVDFNWGEGGPGYGVGVDKFSIRFETQETFSAGFYVFHVRSDDGVRLWVDDNLVLDQWVERAATQNDVTVNLSAGAHGIRLEYFEHLGLAEVKLSFEKLEGPSTTAWVGEYFGNPWLIGTAPVVRNDAEINFDWGSGSPFPSILPADGFSVRWTRTLVLPDAKTLTFKVLCDDGARLWIDNQLVMDQWYDQAAVTTHSVKVPLTAGAHTVVLEYYENQGLASIKASYQ